MDEALLVLLGSVLGFGGSVAGALIVNRRELTRETRITIFRDVLPRIEPIVDVSRRRFEENGYTSKVLGLDDVANELARLAVIAGGEDRRRATEVVEAAEAAMHADFWTHGGGTRHSRNHGGHWSIASADAVELSPLHMEHLEELSRRAAAYAEVLARKIR